MNASEVLGGCSFADSEKLEQVQLPDARIVTGLPIVTSKDSLYFETALSTLSSRRKIARLKAIFKVNENIIPTYVQYLFSEKHCSTTTNFTIGILKMTTYPNVDYKYTNHPEFQLLYVHGILYCEY